MQKARDRIKLRRLIRNIEPIKKSGKGCGRRRIGPTLLASSTLVTGAGHSLRRRACLRRGATCRWPKQFDLRPNVTWKMWAAPPYVESRTILINIKIIHTSRRNVNGDSFFRVGLLTCDHLGPTRNEKKLNLL